jgi:RNA recognition motif-containing protein
MKNNIVWIGRLSPSATDKQLEELFSAHGLVKSVEVMKDKTTGLSRGFGLVGMSSESEAEESASELNGVTIDEKVLTVIKPKRAEALS